MNRTLPAPYQELYRGLSGLIGSHANLEQALNKIRTIRELLEGSSGGTYSGLSHELAVKLDSAICRVIYDNVATPPALDKLHAHKSFATWLRYVRRDSPVEVFTTNYDVLLEIAFEAVGVPFFDGFVGAVAPFFVPECIEAEPGRNSDDVYPPRSWIRLWKLHGSVNWQLIARTAPAPDRICRVTGTSPPAEGTQLLIYPSKEKYVQSQRLPFVVYMDRLRRMIQSGECLLLIIGFSFRDDHITEVLSQGLRSNPRLAITVLLHDRPNPLVLSLAEMYKNLSVLSAQEACVGGIHGSWSLPRKKQPGEEWPFWDDAANSFVLGNFSKFADFLNLMTGYSDTASAFAPSAAGTANSP
ncbi:MAG: SIR2 family protein [Terriglobales bacterium]